MNRTIRSFSLAAMFLIATVAPSMAAVVYLKDGSQLRGTIVGATARDVELYTPNGTLHINADQIIRINYAEGDQPAATPAPSTEAAPTQPTSRYDRGHRYISNNDDLRQLFSFDLGFASPVSRISPSDTGGSSARNGDTGIHLGGQYLYLNTPQLATGLNVEFFNRSASDDFGLIPSAESNVYGDTFLLLGVTKYSFTDRGSARPYLLGGVGLNHTSTYIDATPLPGFSWSDTGTWETRRLLDDSKWGFAYTARVGIDFYLMESTIMGLELGWTGITNSRYQATPAGKDVGLNDVTGRLNALSFALRWGWKF